MTESTTAPRRLTEFSHGAGCACKLGPGDLASVLKPFAGTASPDLIVSGATGDDAAIWRFDADRSLVATADFLTPVVDDPRAWGRVAATNAISDVYAMGGTPLFALTLACWNNEDLPLSMLEEAFQGLQDVAVSAGFAIVGGHTVTDPEPKLGLAVIGLVPPDQMLTNTGLRDGQAIILTKPLGVGVVTTAIKRGLASPGLIDAAITEMTRLNATAARVAVAHGATGATDVTGFGLVNHLGRMARESHVDVCVDVLSVPLLPGVWELAASGVISGGLIRNLAAAEPWLDRGTVEELGVQLLSDPQTSGGLVFGVGRDHVDDVLSELTATGHVAAMIGTASGGSGRFRIV
jgi:selenide, water dikinase